MHSDTAWKHIETHRKKVFTKTSWGCVIPVRNNSLNDTELHSLKPTW